MRIKLLKENFLHNKVISLLILLLCSLTVCISLLSFAIPSFLVYANIEKMHYDYNQFDISIKANNILSTNGVYDSLKGKYEGSIERVVSFYDCALPLMSSDKEMFVQVYEADSKDYQSAFNLNIIPLNNEIVITKEVSEGLNVKVNEYIHIPLKGNEYIYKVVDIIEGKGLSEGIYAMVGGKNISYSYSGINYKFSNHILIDLKDDRLVDEVYPIIKHRYSEYNVTNVLDKELASTMTTDMMKVVCRISCILFVATAVLVCGIYNAKLKKQMLFFNINSQTRYYESIKVIWWLIIFTVSVIIGSIGANLILNIFKPIYHCISPYNISLFCYLQSYLLLMIVPIVLSMKRLPIKVSRKCKNIILSIILLVILVGILIIKKASILALLKVLLAIIGVKLTIDLLIYVLRFLKPSLLKAYLYNFNVKNYFLKNNILIQITMIIVCTVILTSASYYKVTVGNFSEMLEIEEVVATTSKYINTDKYESIKMGDNGQLEKMHLSIMIALDSSQIDEYTNIVLTEEEKNIYENTKSVILSKYHQNVFDLDVGDTVSIRIGEYIEEFNIAKFIDYPVAHFAIMSESDYLYKGYIVNDTVSAKELSEDFKDNNYFIINFKNTFDKIQVLYIKTVDVIVGVFIGLVVFIIIFSVYLFYLDFLYQKENIKKMKTFGLACNSWIKLNAIKNTLVLLSCVILGSLLNYYVMINFDLMLRVVHTVSYITFDLKFALISLILVVTNVIIGFVYTNYEYKKI